MLLISLRVTYTVEVMAKENSKNLRLESANAHLLNPHRRAQDNYILKFSRIFGFKI